MVPRMPPRRNSSGLLFLPILILVGVVVATIAAILNDDNCPELARRFAGGVCGAEYAPGAAPPLAPGVRAPPSQP